MQLGKLILFFTLMTKDNDKAIPSFTGMCVVSVETDKNTLTFPSHNHTRSKMLVFGGQPLDSLICRKKYQILFFFFAKFFFFQKRKKKKTFSKIYFQTRGRIFPEPHVIPSYIYLYNIIICII